MRITFDCPDAWEHKIREKARRNGLVFSTGEPNASLICRQALSIFLFNELSLDKKRKERMTSSRQKTQEV